VRAPADLPGKFRGSVGAKRKADGPSLKGYGAERGVDSRPPSGETRGGEQVNTYRISKKQKRKRGPEKVKAKRGSAASVILKGARGGCGSLGEVARRGERKECGGRATYLEDDKATAD